MGTNKRSKQSSNTANLSDNTWAILSMDRAVARDSGYAATGGIAQNYEGNWIGYRQILFLTDNHEVAQTLPDLDLEDYGITVLRMTQRIMKAEGVWKIKHIPRTRNLVADCLAKLSLNWKSRLQVFNEAPKEIIDLLQEDKDNGCLM
ncbi:hypothetical protein PVK06_034625 [Gossypium arboreum]|uniref:RNase H type-1 domain-containing protein n=1 Tax=Gossypium arboreum TaxID=29729 RepID=A0ABR0NFS1_GOSAR|nr:hypothetical protein PVK06_034625 [Gossypium arboreum]